MYKRDKQKLKKKKASLLASTLFLCLKTLTLSGFTSLLAQGHMWEPLISPLSQKFSEGQMYLHLHAGLGLAAAGLTGVIRKFM
jgi:hypothetical protein